jgi:aspartyl/asparaginyl beta-hydroxylase (cupin superfamily)
MEAARRSLARVFIMSNVYLPQNLYIRVQKILVDGREKYGAAAVERISHAFAIVAGLAPAVASEFRLQRPGEFLFPGLSARPWYDVSDFGFRRDLEASASLIRSELESVLGAPNGFQTYRQDAIVPRGRWAAFYFRVGNTWFDENRELCPRTFRILESVPRLAEIAVFSALAPGTHLVPHCGAWNCKLTFHLGLVIPGNCALRVGDETRVWESGKLNAFDDTFEHEAWNNSDEERYILLFDVWHPELSDIEVELLEQLRAYAGFHDGTHTVAQARADRIKGQESRRDKNA